MNSFGSNTPTFAGGLVAGAILALVAVSVLFRGSVHF